nr:fibroblast growth factor 5 isoform X2 [Microcebus murinus]
MSLSFLLLLFFSHLILSARAREEKRADPRGRPAGPAAATGRNRGGDSDSHSGGSGGARSSSSSPASASPAGGPGGGSEQGRFSERSPSGRRTGSLYCRVGIGFHLQIYPDGKVNGSHEANVLSQVHRRLQVQGAVSGEQLQHVRLGHPQERGDGAGVVRGLEQKGESKEGVQPPGETPARVYPLPPKIQAVGAAGTLLHGDRPREEDAT